MTAIQDNDPIIVWGAEEIGKLIRRNGKQVYRMIVSGELKVGKKGGRYFVAKEDLLSQFKVERT
jgi:hypothetical protein